MSAAGSKTVVVSADAVIWAVAATPVLVVAVFVAAVVGEARLRRRNRVVSARLEAQL